MNFLDVLSLLESYSWGTIILGLFIFFALNPEKLDYWKALFFRIFASFNRSSERKTISSEIQSSIHHFVSKYKGGTIMPYGIKFKWTTGKNFESFVKGGDVFVYMEDYHNTSKNFVSVITSWTSNGFLPTVKPYLPKQVFTASEIIIQEKLISEERPGAIDYYRDHIYNQKIQDVPGTEGYKKKFDRIDKKGLFHNVFLTELSDFGKRFKDIFISDADDEIDSMIKVLEDIAARKPGGEVQLIYGGIVFKIQIILVAKEHRKGIRTESYIKRAKQAVSDGQNSIYIMARNQKIRFLEPLIKEIIANTPTKLMWKKYLKTTDYSGKIVDTSVCLLRIKS